MRRLLLAIILASVPAFGQGGFILQDIPRGAGGLTTVGEVVCVTATGTVGMCNTVTPPMITKTTEQLRLRYDASNYLSLTVGATGSATLASAGTNSDITITPQRYTILNGNVGLGTTGPDVKLAVRGTNVAFTVGQDANNILQFQWNDISAYGKILTREGATYYDSTIVLKAGNVGMGGLIAPPNKLSVLGTTGIYGGYTNVSNNYGLTATSVDGTFTFSTVTNGTGADDQSMVFTPSGTGGITLNGNSLTLNGVTPAATGVRYLCVSTTGVISSNATACVGT